MIGGMCCDRRVVLWDWGMCCDRRVVLSCVRDVGDPQEKLLLALNERTVEIFKRCDFDATGNPSTLSMLTTLEVRAE